MIDFWIAIMLTSIVSFLTVMIDWLAYTIIVGAKTLRNLREIIGSGLPAQDITSRVKDELVKHQDSRSKSLVWGSDLATVSLSLDFTILGIWIHNSSFFPFFSRFNTTNVKREIPVWLIIIGAHLILLIISLVMKHKHGETVGSLQSAQTSDSEVRVWFVRNRWMLAGNISGFISLLSCIITITNALRV